MVMTRPRPVGTVTDDRCNVKGTGSSRRHVRSPSLDVGEVEAGGRLVEDGDVALLGHVNGQLQPLPFATRQRGERLADAEVAEPDVPPAFPIVTAPAPPIVAVLKENALGEPTCG